MKKCIVVVYLAAVLPRVQAVHVEIVNNTPGHLIITKFNGKEAGLMSKNQVKYKRNSLIPRAITGLPTLNKFFSIAKILKSIEFKYCEDSDEVLPIHTASFVTLDLCVFRSKPKDSITIDIKSGAELYLTGPSPIDETKERIFHVWKENNIQLFEVEEKHKVLDFSSDEPEKFNFKKLFTLSCLFPSE